MDLTGTVTVVTESGRGLTLAHAHAHAHAREPGRCGAAVVIDDVDAAPGAPVEVTA